MNKILINTTPINKLSNGAMGTAPTSSTSSSNPVSAKTGVVAIKKIKRKQKVF
jgi:hypothetical protein